MLLMERLQATQQLDLALEVARYVFDPTVDGTGPERCWLFPPFRNVALNPTDSIKDVLDQLQPSSGAESTMDVALAKWRRSPFTAHAIARGRSQAYMKWIAIKYIEIPIASGDEYFRQNTLEAIPLAIQQYVEASHIYGPPPRSIPKLGKRKYKTFSSLESLLNDFSNAAVDMELEFPFVSNPAGRGSTIGASTVAGIMRR
ncbi:MAG: hypothetical protein M1813_008844 [Trichoglossum hirsutum]|nr:MAG: hypothetical protein M1813_008844 [Trichoglossum hirsutum]